MGIVILGPTLADAMHIGLRLRSRDEVGAGGELLHQLLELIERQGGFVTLLIVRGGSEVGWNQFATLLRICFRPPDQYLEYYETRLLPALRSCPGTFIIPQGVGREL